MREIELTDEEKTWLDENGVEGSLPGWKAFQVRANVSELAAEVKYLDKLTSSKMRRELRLIHGDRTRKIQEAADKGRIGGILRKLLVRTRISRWRCCTGMEGK